MTEVTQIRIVINGAILTNRSRGIILPKDKH